MERHIGTIDWVTLLLILCLSSFGLFLLLSIAQPLFIQQLLFLCIGVILLFIVSRLDPAILWWAAPFLYAGALLFLGLSYLGPTIRGATRWIFIGGIQIQPSELVKPFMLLAFSRFLTEAPPKSAKNICIHLGLFIIPFLLIFKQPDLGTSMVYTSFWLAMMVAGGLPIAVIVIGGLVGSVFLPFVWHALAPFQKARIVTFLSPGIDPKGAGYNALQSMIAVGSGQVFGRGLGRGTQSHLRFLPEFHTDFIFATLVEELGFLGGSLLILGYAVLLWRILCPLFNRVVTHAFPFIFSVGLLSMILSQVFINTGMNMGIIPITGITLPFVSYGGSSLLSLCVSFGMLWSLARMRSN